MKQEPEKLEIQQPKAIPKIIHFIWAGGNELLPRENLENIVKWCQQNKDFQIQLWVDKSTVGGEGVQEQTQKILQDLQQKLEIMGVKDVDLFNEDIGHSVRRTNCGAIVIKDIEHNNVCTEFVRYEMGQVSPNYGASSDLLRYRILGKYGGAYFDSDVLPGQQPLSTCQYFHETPVKHVLFIDHMSQRSSPCADAAGKFQLEGTLGKDICIPGNDSLISTAGNPVILRVAEIAENNYNLRNNHRMDEMIRTAYFSHHIRDITIERTGTDVIKSALFEQQGTTLLDTGRNAYLKKIGNHDINIMPLRCRDVQLCQPCKFNQRKWLDVNVPTSITPQQSIQSTINTIKSELNYFGILRLDDHIQLLKQVARNHSIDPNTHVESFMRKLQESNIDLNAVVVAQWASRDEHVKRFYESNDLLRKTCILENTSTTDFTKIYHYATSLGLMQELARKNNITKEEMKDHRGELIGYIRCMRLGIEFITKICTDNLKHPSFLSDNTHDILESYRNVCHAFKDIFPDDIKLNPKELEEVDDILIQKALRAHMSGASQSQDVNLESKKARRDDSGDKGGPGGRGRGGFVMK